MKNPETYYISDNGIFPGNRLPVLHYKNALKLPFLFAARYVKTLFDKHDWTNTWRDGVYTYHHYHSNTHEAMAVIKGETALLLGGENGRQVALRKGDIIVIPAGVAHKNLGEMKDIICVGGYPEGRDFDMNYGGAGERPQTDWNIEALPLPSTGPLAGREDPLIQLWKQQNHAIHLSW